MQIKFVLIYVHKLCFTAPCVKMSYTFPVVRHKFVHPLSPQIVKLSKVWIGNHYFVLKNFLTGLLVIRIMYLSLRPTLSFSKVKSKIFDSVIVINTMFTIIAISFHVNCYFESHRFLCKLFICACHHFCSITIQIKS